jgi:hypothetical protein
MRLPRRVAGLLITSNLELRERTVPGSQGTWPGPARGRDPVAPPLGSPTRPLVPPFRPLAGLPARKDQNSSCLGPGAMRRVRRDFCRAVGGVPRAPCIRRDARLHPPDPALVDAQTADPHDAPPPSGWGDRMGTECACAKGPYSSLLAISSTFDPLFRVLFTFPSQYFCTIGLPVVFSFGWDLPPVEAALSSNPTLGLGNGLGARRRPTGLSPSAAKRSSSLGHRDGRHEHPICKPQVGRPRGPADSV